MEFAKKIKESTDKMLSTETSEMFNINPRLLHAILGIADEAGEFVKYAKSRIYYNSEQDLTNLKEELGDVWWYMRLAMDEIGVIEGVTVAHVFDQVMAMNDAKLAKRYDGGYSNDKAVKRDTSAEREVLEDTEKQNSSEKKS